MLYNDITFNDLVKQHFFSLSMCIAAAIASIRR